ncbi:NAD-dependent epimerase/dehydratase family protein [Epilithonimonas arachidiradicis]|uniref:Nucleoside-diphosphate-sugar epimerase n=1 Tax=Epilithonimonas arachidiradicis TaxID=1617282 RepID=A0A420DBV5_9FLAO|nr:NAD-dependent epimerase/dehydratase family protein [Epilithonimonas arachidiradicis]RKE89013.1 nucleoside-diphosphate-sugar epimerase [Epilithonimonas arachidiradicis]GGG53265.1 nucleoside-diphosphate-sugar epimerase [Epilithonimonas arachidiradicis]
MKVLITGASGFVGTNLATYLLREGFEIYKLSLRSSWKLSTDLDAIIHLAGKAHDTTNISDDNDYYKINTELTVKLFDDFLKSSIRDFFYFSSVKAAADTVEGILSEEHFSNPQTIYGKSKLDAENYLISKILPENKRLFIIRPCMIHGPGNKGNLNLLYKIVEKSLPWPLAAFENKRSFLSISNLNFLIMKILENRNVPSGIYNFSDDESLSTNELVSVIANTIGQKPKLWNITPWLIFLVAKIGNIIKLPLNSERLKKLTESYVVSNAKIKAVIGIEKLPITAEDGLRATIDSFNKSK